MLSSSGFELYSRWVPLLFWFWCNGNTKEFKHFFTRTPYAIPLNRMHRQDRQQILSYCLN